VLMGGLGAAADLAWRLRSVRTLKVAPPPTVFTREGPVRTRPQPVTNLLNMLLSGEKGAQFLCVVPGRRRDRAVGRPRPLTT
jgi:hypothetical protein